MLKMCSKSSMKRYLSSISREAVLGFFIDRLMDDLSVSEVHILPDDIELVRSRSKQIVFIIRVDDKKGLTITRRMDAAGKVSKSRVRK